MLFFTLINNFKMFSQLDSSVTYVNELAKWKVVYDVENTYFFKKVLTKSDTTKWELYASWYDTDSERYYYDYDSLGNEHLNYKETWDSIKRFSYMIDSAGNANLVAYTIYYGTNPTYGLPSAIDTVRYKDIIVTTYENIISLEATKIINEIKIYNVEGTLMNIFRPNVAKMKIVTNSRGLLILKIKYNDTKWAVKKVLIVY